MTFHLFEDIDWSCGIGVPSDPNVRSVNMVQVGRALTDPDMDPRVRALIVYNSNPAEIAPNQNAVLEGLRREDLFTVVLEHVMTDTALHADYVLPATTEVEHLDVLWSWGQTYLTYNDRAIDPVGDASAQHRDLPAAGRAAWVRRSGVPGERRGAGGQRAGATRP